MITKIIVPLDGSALSEKALPYATRLANQLKAGLTLLRVEEAQRFTPHLPTHKAQSATQQAQPYSDTIQLERFEAEEAYMQKIKAFLTSPAAETPLPDTQVEALVVYGKTPAQLATIIKEIKGDLVVMTTHGRSGLSLLLMGSIATELIQHTTSPVILIKPVVTSQPVLTEANAPIVVTLDRSHDSEVILDAASNLALQLEVKLHLIQVVAANLLDLTGQLYISSNYDADKECAQLKDAAEAHLRNLQAELQAKGVDCIISVICGEPIIGGTYNPVPIYKITEYAQIVKAQLVVMATHARGRVGQVILGSAAEEEVRQSNLPVMLVKIPAHNKNETEH